MQKEKPLKENNINKVTSNTKQIEQYIVEKGKIDRNLPIGEQLFSILKHNIISGNLPEDIRITEQAISNIFSISRTPVREAFKKLEKLKIIKITPYVGASIYPINKKNVLEAINIRKNLERFIINEIFKKENIQNLNNLEELEINLLYQNIAIKEKNMDKFHQLDDQFHQLISNLANLSIINGLIENLSVHLSLSRLSYLQVNVANQTLEEHKSIFLAVKSKNHEQALKTTELHMDKLELRIRNKL